MAEHREVRRRVGRGSGAGGGRVHHRGRRLAHDLRRRRALGEGRGGELRDPPGDGGHPRAEAARPRQGQRGARGVRLGLALRAALRGDRGPLPGLGRPRGGRRRQCPGPVRGARRARGGRGGGRQLQSEGRRARGLPASARRLRPDAVGGVAAEELHRGAAPEGADAHLHGDGPRGARRELPAYARGSPPRQSPPRGVPRSGGPVRVAPEPVAGGGAARGPRAAALADPGPPRHREDPGSRHARGDLRPPQPPGERFEPGALLRAQQRRRGHRVHPRRRARAGPRGPAEGRPPAHGRVPRLRLRRPAQLPRLRAAAGEVRRGPPHAAGVQRRDRAGRLPHAEACQPPERQPEDEAADSAGGAPGQRVALAVPRRRPRGEREQGSHRCGPGLRAPAAGGLQGGRRRRRAAGEVPRRPRQGACRRAQGRPRHFRHVHLLPECRPGRRAAGGGCAGGAPGDCGRGGAGAGTRDVVRADALPGGPADRAHRGPEADPGHGPQCGRQPVRHRGLTAGAPEQGAGGAAAAPEPAVPHAPGAQRLPLDVLLRRGRPYRRVGRGTRARFTRAPWQPRLAGAVAFLGLRRGGR
mmetsp:Transcript_72767/g.205784  ORF Transcript_72767/g.205784 Transcript_72767/m.205784 type:complete len:584 (-) Transcript_72767:722-2473(-)